MLFYRLVVIFQFVVASMGVTSVWQPVRSLPRISMAQPFLQKCHCSTLHITKFPQFYLPSGLGPLTESTGIIDWISCPRELENQKEDQEWFLAHVPKCFLDESEDDARGSKLGR